MSLSSPASGQPADHQATRIGLIADIHANLSPLHRALEIFRQHNVSQVLCAGDLVEKGAEGDAVVELIRAASILCVMGNHDFDVIGNQAWLRENSDLSHPALSGVVLKEETLRFLKHLPRSLTFDWNGRRLFLAHGAPWSTNEYIFPTSYPHVFERLVREAQADVVILGHTHVPMCVQVGSTLILNPGAVCGNRNLEATCAVLTLPALDFRIYSLETGSVINLRP